MHEVHNDWHRTWVVNCLKQEKAKETGGFIIKMGPVCQIRRNKPYPKAVMNH